VRVPRRAAGPALLALLVVALGLAIVARTIAAGVGGGLGLLIGGLLVLGGALRLWLVSPWRRG
jgi:hypothetical protein